MSASRMSPTSSSRNAGRGKWEVLAILLLVLTGCASAPVQEMSDARQAVRAAQEAGAARSAPQDLGEAETLLARAESYLNKRFFRAARRHAEQAHEKAVAALQTAKASEKKE